MFSSSISTFKVHRNSLANNFTLTKMNSSSKRQFATGKRKGKIRCLYKKKVTPATTPGHD
jgi:hypothetical protein